MGAIYKTQGHTQKSAPALNKRRKGERGGGARQRWVTHPQAKRARRRKKILRHGGGDVGGCGGMGEVWGGAGQSGCRF